MASELPTPLLHIDSILRSILQSISDQQIRCPSIVPAVDQGDAPLEPHVGPDVKGKAVGLGFDVFPLHALISRLGVLQKIGCAIPNENGFVLPSAPPIHPPVKIPYGAALPQQSGSFRSEPEGRIVRPQGRIRKGEKAEQQNDSQKFPQYHVTSLPLFNTRIAPDCPGLPPAKARFIQDKHPKTNGPQDAYILEQRRLIP